MDSLAAWRDVDLHATLDGLSLLEENGTWLVGDRSRTDFVAVPPVGAAVIRWLLEGKGLEETCALAGEMQGQAVDVPGFLDGLRRAGVVASTAARPHDPPRPWGVALGRAFSSRAHAIAWGVLVLAAACLLVASPALRPDPGDARVLTDPLGSLLLLAVVSTGCTLLHEAAHCATAGARGVASRLTISRRLYFVTAQADLTGLWAIPRRQRYVPLLAGLAVDLEVLAVAVVIETFAAVRENAGLLALDRAVVLVQASAAVFQCAVFLRTDLYAVLATASGSTSFRATANAQLRSLCRRADGSDRSVLARVGRREIAWVRGYLVVFVTGNLVAPAYLALVLAPGLVGLVRTCVASVATLDPSQGSLWRGVAGLLLIAAPSAWAVAASCASAVHRAAGLLRDRSPAAS